MKFTEASRDFLAYIKMTRSDGTYRFQEAKIDVMNRYFQTKDIDAIDKKDVVALLQYLKERNPDIAAATLNKYVAVLKRVIKYNTNKDLFFEKLPEQKKIIPVLNEKTIHRVFSYYQKNLYRPEMLRNYTLFRLILDTGLRISEALSLKPRDIDFETNTIHVKITKTKVERYVFFTNTTAGLLKKLLSDGVNRELIFINYYDMKPLSSDNILRVCYRLQKKLTLKENIRPHKWRHTFATNFLKSGGNLETLRMIMGHTTLLTTQVYLHIDKDHLRQDYFRIYV